MKACSPARLLFSCLGISDILWLENIGEMNFSSSLKLYGWPKKAVFTKLRSEDPLGANAANEQVRRVYVATVS